MIEHLKSGEEILSHLQARNEFMGRLNTFTTEGAEGGALLRVFYRHQPDYELGAPGTRMRPAYNGKDLNKWRIVKFPKPILGDENPDAFVVRLSDIVETLPAEIGEWALNAQKAAIDHIEESLPGNAQAESLQSELRQAQKSVI